jgi:flagellar basal-body rod protein FlgB
MNAISATILLKSLDGLEVRGRVISQNIANSGTKGYRPLKVTFEAALARASHGSMKSIEAVEPTIVVAIDEFGRSQLRLDLEMANAAMTSSRFSTMAELLNRRLQIDALSVSGVR